MTSNTDSSFRGRPVLVTGAGGFIGSHLAARLVAAGARVRALVRYNSRDERGWIGALDRSVQSEIDVVLGDVRDTESVARAVAGNGIVFHLAAQIAIPYSYVNPRDFVETNITGTLNVALAARDSGVERVVQTSTSEVYGTARIVPIDEDHPLEPQSPYAASKLAADKLIQAFHCSFDLPATVLRPFNTYGPHQSARAIIPTIVSQALAGDTVRLGSLDPRRDLTFVSDTVEGFLAAAASPAAVGNTIQLGTGHDISVRELVDLVSEILGKPLTVAQDPARVRPPRSEVMRLISSPRRARELIDWRPRVDLREGLTRTIDWMSENTAHYRVDHYVI